MATGPFVVCRSETGVFSLTHDKMSSTQHPIGHLERQGSTTWFRGVIVNPISAFVTMLVEPKVDGRLGKSFRKCPRWRESCEVPVPSLFAGTPKESPRFIHAQM